MHNLFFCLSSSTLVINVVRIKFPVFYYKLCKLHGTPIFYLKHSVLFYSYYIAVKWLLMINEWLILSLLWQ